jgi:hypothetical protein
MKMPMAAPAAPEEAEGAAAPLAHLGRRGRGTRCWCSLVLGSCSIPLWLTELLDSHLVVCMVWICGVEKVEFHIVLLLFENPLLEISPCIMDQMRHNIRLYNM